MPGKHSSVAVILCRVGTELDLSSLGDLPSSRVLSAQFALGDTSSCVAATLEHDCPITDLAAELRVWAARKGWSVTVAPLRGSD